MKRFLGVIMICALLLCALALPASAALENPNVRYVSSRMTVVRQKASSQSKALKKLGFGETIEVLVSDRTWTKVRFGKNEVGYVDDASLSEKNPNTLSHNRYVQSENLKVCALPDGDSKKLGTLKRNQSVVAVAYMFDWLRIAYKDGYGYIRCSYTDDRPYDASAAAPVWCVATIAYVQDVPDSFSEYNETIQRMFYGEKCTRIGTTSDGKYARLRNAKGRVGYVPVGDVSVENPNTMDQTAYLLYAGRALYKEPQGDFYARNAGTKLAKGTKVTVVSVSSDGLWARVKYKGKYRYMPRVLLSDDKSVKAQKIVVNVGDCELYRDANRLNQYSVLKKGDRLTVTGMKSGGVWLKVETGDGKTGYVRIEYVKLDD